MRETSDNSGKKHTWEAYDEVAFTVNESLLSIIKKKKESLLSANSWNARQKERNREGHVTSKKKITVILSRYD